MQNLKNIPWLCLFFVFSVSLAAQTVGDVEYGLASYYADDYQGRKTSYGETYDKNQLTGAHKLFPYNSRIRVTRIDNGRSVIVRIIDQGPYIHGRVVELSRRAAEGLDLVKDATAEVKVELLELPGGDVATRSPRPTTTTTTTAPAPAPRSSSSQLPAPQDRLREVEVTTTIAENRAQQPTSYSTVPSRTAPSTGSNRASWSANTASKIVTNDYKQFGLYKIEIRKPTTRGYGVQVASLTDYEGAMRKVAELQSKWFDNILVSIEPDSKRQPVYKVILGPFDSEPSAQRYERDLARKYRIKGFTVNLNDIKY